MALDEYRAKRNFQETAEPGPLVEPGHRQPLFVIQEHHASRLHYDFRLEAEGVLKSWAVPKEPSMDPGVKRLAVQVEDHPLAYARFSGRIPEGQYGAGTVSIWDNGTYENRSDELDMTRGIKRGRLEFDLHGRRLRGRFALIRIAGRRGSGKDNWLLIKMKDQFATRTALQMSDGAVHPPRKPKAALQTRRAKSPRRVEITHPDKVIFPEAGITKGEVVEYYRTIAPRLLPYLRDRPMTLERLPDGLAPASPHFWQKATPSYYPEWIPRIDLPTERGKSVHYALVNDLPTLLYLVNQGTLTFHPWMSRVGNLDRPDFVLFDVDRGAASFDDVVAVTRRIHDALIAEGAQSWPKTSGKTGLHVLVRWSMKGGFEEARDWALTIARRIVAALPDRATVERLKARRGKRVYIDVMQNARGHHAVPPYVLRAVPRATVSMPLAWREVGPGLDPAHFDMYSALRRLRRQKRDPMQGLL